MHGNDRTTSIVIWKTFSIERGRSNYQFQRPLPVLHSFLQQSKQYISVQRSLVRFVKDDHMVFKQIRIRYALPHKYAISYKPQSCLGAGLIVKPYGIAHLWAHYTSSFWAHPWSHTDGSHPSGLGYDHIDVVDRFLLFICVFLDSALTAYDALPYLLGIHHVLRQLCWFSWTCISSHNQVLVVFDRINNLVFVLVDGQSFPELIKIL